MPTSPLLDAIDADAFDWLTQHAPRYVTAIEAEIRQGRTPAEIRYIVASNVGPDRQGLALRCAQAARHMTGAGDGEA